jgi:hypothetical protein
MRDHCSLTPSPSAAAGRPGLAQADGVPEAVPAGRALVLLSAASSAPQTSGPRPCAGFLAQLIATAQQAPQTRQRRRAAPDEANASYTAAATPAAWMGRTIYRSM